ncbi:MAG: threonine synthase [Oscillospiraceae bacterium]|nr:threonine synthase [Oscillospiraceae bacterium]
MTYVSTRGKHSEVTAAGAIAQGISQDGGLFVPKTLPHISDERLSLLLDKSYTERACDILSGFLTDFTKDEIDESVSMAYGGEKFGSGNVAPIVKLSPRLYMLELFHGPTCAFKDMALQLLPHLLTLSAKKTAGDKKIAILVATSGDTGKAALEGFRDVEGTEIIVFYPKDGVSGIQQLQMATQEGANIGVCAVSGNFDDTQNGVKAIFTDEKLKQRLTEKNMMFSSANSINWGRLVPQICYYASAYCDMVKNGEIALGERVNVCVPTGNFGNILAAYYAKHMGVPFKKLICASNANNVLTDFINTGVYDRRREFILTSSPSMDILISSNLERLLFELYEKDDDAVKLLMKKLSADGVYSVSANVARKLKDELYGGFSDEADTAKTIRDTFKAYAYLLDTHTAVGLKVANDYIEKTGDAAKIIIAATASPFKFTGSILSAITGESSGLDEFEQAKKLSGITGAEIPPRILAMKDKPVRFTEYCEKSGMEDYVIKTLGL